MLRGVFSPKTLCVRYATGVQNISMRWVPRLLLIVLAIVALGIGFWIARDRIALQLPNIRKPSFLPQADFTTLWVSNFAGNVVFAVNRAGETVWEQHMASAPIPPRSANVHVEYVTVAPKGSLVIADGEGMMVQELDRTTHELVWQYGVRSVQGHGKGYLHQPDKAFKLNDHEVLINDGNNRRVIIVDQRTNEIVWQYGKTLTMGSGPGLLRGNTHAVPVERGKRILITDTLEKKLLLVDRATQNIVWEWAKPDAKWLQHAFPTAEGTFVLEDRQKNEVFEVNRQGEILWTLSDLADGSRLQHPTDAAKLGNGNVLIADAGHNRIIEVRPRTGEIVWQYGAGKPTSGTSAGFPSTIALDTFDSGAAPARAASQSDHRTP